MSLQSRKTSQRAQGPARFTPPPRAVGAPRPVGSSMSARPDRTFIYPLLFIHFYYLSAGRRGGASPCERGGKTRPASAASAGASRILWASSAALEPRQPIREGRAFPPGAASACCVRRGAGCGLRGGCGGKAEGLGGGAAVVGLR